MFIYFLSKIKKFFGVMHNTERKRAERRIKTCRNPATKARPPREKKAIRKRVSADAFSRRAFLPLRVFLVSLVWGRRFDFTV